MVADNTGMPLDSAEFVMRVRLDDFERDLQMADTRFGAATRRIEASALTVGNIIGRNMGAAVRGAQFDWSMLGTTGEQSMQKTSSAAFILTSQVDKMRASVAATRLEMRQLAADAPGVNVGMSTGLVPEGSGGGMSRAGMMRLGRMALPMAGMAMMSLGNEGAGGVAQEAIGGAMIGSIGGPWGAAAGAVIGLTTGIVKLGDASEKAAAQLAENNAAFIESDRISRLPENQQALESVRTRIRETEKAIEAVSGFRGPVSGMSMSPEEATLREELLGLRNIEGRLAREKEAGDAAAVLAKKEKELTSALKSSEDSVYAAAEAQVKEADERWAVWARAKKQEEELAAVKAAILAPYEAEAEAARAAAEANEKLAAQIEDRLRRELGLKYTKTPAELMEDQIREKLAPEVREMEDRMRIPVSAIARRWASEESLGQLVLGSRRLGGVAGMTGMTEEQRTAQEQLKMLKTINESVKKINFGFN